MSLSSMSKHSEIYNDTSIWPSRSLQIDTKELVTYSPEENEREDYYKSR